jgi:hypothetical protein
LSKLITVEFTVEELKHAWNVLSLSEEAILAAFRVDGYTPESDPDLIRSIREGLYHSDPWIPITAVVKRDDVPI